jgi:hypothetical protein
LTAKIPAPAGAKTKRNADRVIPLKESQTEMRERDREIKRRRQRYEKRKKLRAKLATVNESERPKIEEKILKTYPRYTTTI